MFFFLDFCHFIVLLVCGFAREILSVLLQEKVLDHVNP